MRGWITPDALARRAVNEPEKDELPKSNTRLFLDFCLPSTKLVIENIYGDHCIIIYIKELSPILSNLEFLEMPLPGVQRFDMTLHPDASLEFGVYPNPVTWAQRVATCWLPFMLASP